MEHLRLHLLVFLFGLGMGIFVTYILPWLFTVALAWYVTEYLGNPPNVLQSEGEQLVQSYLYIVIFLTPLTGWLGYRIGQKKSAIVVALVPYLFVLFSSGL